MADPRTLLQRALTDLDRGPPDLVALFGPAKIRELTVDWLRADGCGLTGDDATVERLIAYATPEVVNALLELERSSTPTRKGRPRNDIFDMTIYAAAYFKFVGEAKRAARAARWLGAPATKDRVDRNMRRFIQSLHIAYSAIGAPEKMFEAAMSIVLEAQGDLEKLERKIEAERRAESARRKSSRFSSFSARP